MDKENEQRECTKRNKSLIIVTDLYETIETGFEERWDMTNKYRLLAR